MPGHHMQTQRAPVKRLFQSQHHTEGARNATLAEEAPRTVISGLNSWVTQEVAALQALRIN